MEREEIWDGRGQGSEMALRGTDGEGGAQRGRRQDGEMNAPDSAGGWGETEG